MDQLPGEKLLEKIWGTLADNFIGGFLRPWQIRRVGRAITDAQIDNKLRIAQAERDEEAIRKGEVLLENNSTLVLTHKSKKDIEGNSSSHVLTVHDISTVLIADAARKEINVAKALLHAEAAAMENKDSISEDTVNSDWLFRWRDSAGEVSNEELQTLWGKVLAGEAKSPGTFSLRTLETLRNISKKEAEFISKLAPYILSGCIWRNEKLNDKGLSYGHMLNMQELGIVNGVETLGLTRTISSINTTTFLAVLLGTDRALVIKHADPKKTLQLECYKLTTVGIEIMKLCTAASDKDYLRELGRQFGDDFEVFIATYRSLGEEEIEWRKEETVSPRNELVNPK